MKKIETIILLFISLNCFSIEVKTVGNVKEFFEALGNNTEIIIECATLNFTLENLEKELSISSSYEHLGTGNNPVKWESQSYYLASGIVLHQYENLTIRSKAFTNIISENDWDNILTFKKCKNITLENLSIFHTPETCNGSVLSLTSSNKIKVINCSLNGSGGIGANLVGSQNVTFTNVAIYNNVFYAVYSVNSKNINFIGCTIYNNHDWGKSLIYADISGITFKKCIIENNESKNLVYSRTENIFYFPTQFKDCDISENSFDSKYYFKELEKHPKKINRNKQREVILKLLVQFLKEELPSDHDGNNDELLSFFAKDHIIYHNQIQETSDFLDYYFELKQNKFKVENQNSTNGEWSILLVQDESNKRIQLNVFFNKKNKIVRMEEK